MPCPSVCAPHVASFTFGKQAVNVVCISLYFDGLHHLRNFGTYLPAARCDPAMGARGGQKIGPLDNNDAKNRPSCDVQHTSERLIEGRSFACIFGRVSFYPRRVALFTDELARRNPRRVAFAALLLFKLTAAAFVVLRTALLLLRASLLPSRSTTWTALLRLRAFCAALAFAAIVPMAAPMDSAKLVKSATSFACLRVRAFIYWLRFNVWMPCFVEQGSCGIPMHLDSFLVKAMPSSLGCTRCRRRQSRPALGLLPYPQLFVLAASDLCPCCEPD
jgi:hypothetical protein